MKLVAHLVVSSGEKGCQYLMLSKVAVTACAVAFGFAVKDQLIRLVPVPLKREKPPVTSQSYSTTSVSLGNDRSSSDVSQENPNVPIKRKVTLPGMLRVDFNQAG